jgi:hypothetical protein
MKRISTMVSDEAKQVLIDYKDELNFTTLDEALQDLLIKFNNRRVEDEREYQADVYAQIEHENKDPEED